MKLLGITSYPNGIAHTYMAAEKLSKTAAKLGVDMKVETQGTIGVENELTLEEIAAADGIIIAADKAVLNKERFKGKRVLETGVTSAIKKPEELIKQFETGEVPIYGKAEETPENKKEPVTSIQEVKKERKSKQNPIYRHLMNGVSYMIPFVVIGGLLIAISLAIGGQPTPEGVKIPDGSFWKTVNDIGVAGFTFMIPILAGFIAVSIADRPGLVPGMVGGFIAANGSFYGSAAGAGFIGGIIAGFLAGYVAKGIKSLKVPSVIQPIMPILIIPIFSTLIVGLLFIFLLGTPIANLMEGLTNWLNSMQGSSSIILALILGAMISFDMGGPFNKVAFLFGASMIGQGNAFIMGSIAAAICVPPLGMGLATLLNKRKYEAEEQYAGKAALAMGLFGITEGAIPFAAKDPLRVIPSIMVRSMVAAVIAMLSKVTDSVPHGGPIVAVFNAVGNVGMFFVALAIGTVITAIMVNVLKKEVPQDDQ